MSMLVIGHQWPEPDATAAGERMLWLLEGFLRKGYQITFASTSAPGTYEADLESLGIEKVSIQLNSASFDRFITTRRFSLVLFDRFLTEEQFSWRVRECLPKALLLLDTEDLHSLRHSRGEAVRQGKAWSTSDWLQDPLFYREVASMFRADLNLIISNREMELLTEQIPLLKDKLLYLPFGIISRNNLEGPEFQRRSDFVFIGNGKHRPNLDAISQLKSEIWPLIRRLLPKEKIRIYGAYLPQSILQFHAPFEGFEVKGWAPDLQAVLSKARVQLAPLRYGAGIKGKILKAAQNGLPTMGTAFGFEGILTVSEAMCFTADTPDDFAKKSAHLYQDEPTWTKALSLQKEAAKEHLCASFDTLSKQVELLQEGAGVISGETQILENLLRNEAFGRVRYLSRWIEAKEKGAN